MAEMGAEMLGNLQAFNSGIILVVYIGIIILLFGLFMWVVFSWINKKKNNKGD